MLQAQDATFSRVIPGFATSSRNKTGFTLVELLVIIAIMGLMVTVGIASVRSGQGAARVKGATRDVFAAIRQARSLALVTQQPAVITYSTEESDGEPIAKIEITSAKLFAPEIDRSKMQTITGEPLKGAGRELVHVEKDGGDAIKGKNADGTEADDAGGETLEDVLFSPMGEEVVKGMRLKVVMGDEGLDDGLSVRKPKLSVFSNVDYLLGKYKSAKEKTEEKKDASGDGKESASLKEERQEPVSVVWETNGRVDPHQVWVYADGQRPEQGLSIRIDRFGGAKVLSGDGREDDE